MSNVPGVPGRFTVQEIQRVPRTEPPSKPPPKKPADDGGTIVVAGHGWRTTIPIALIAAAGSLFAGRQTAPAVDQTQALVEMRTETRADIAEIKRDISAIRERLVRNDDDARNRLTAIELKMKLAEGRGP